MLCALEGTRLADMYRNGEIDFMTEDEYVSTVCDFLEYLSPKTTIHRLAGNGLRTELVAPRWIGRKLDTLNRIDREFLRRDSWQGKKFI
jgi:radical SAM superfamily enzyme